MILYKSGKIGSEFHGMNPNLQAVAYFMAGYMMQKFGLDLVITSILRDNSATHERGDGFDMRENMTKAQGDDLVKVTNERFNYGSGHDTVVDERTKPPEPTNWSAPHYHIQANWRKKNRGWR